MTYETNKTTRKRVDKRLKEIASIQANLGNDSTKTEIEQAKKEQRVLWSEIKEIDKEFWEQTYKIDRL